MASDDKPAPEAPENESDLFRKEAVTARQQHAIGSIVMARAVSLQILTFCFGIVTVSLLLFVCLSHVTRREHVSGQLAFDRRTAKIYSPSAGVVIKRRVKEGELVVKGQSLYVISSDLRSSARGSMGEEVIDKLSSRRAARIMEREKRSVILSEEFAALIRKQQNLNQQRVSVANEGAIASERNAANSINLIRYDEMSSRGLYSVAELSERRQENLDQRAQLEALRSRQLAIQGQIEENKSEIKNFPYSSNNELSGIDREVAQMEQEIAEDEGKREINVVSEIPGTVTACLVDAGQYVNSSALLVSVVPKEAQLIAQLDIPSSAVGFIKAGTIVLLRYDAFPYQKFGQFRAEVQSVSRTALQPGDLQMLAGGKEAYYRVAARIRNQSVVAFGVPVHLRDGMKFEADILLERRSIIDWMLEPLYTIRGRLTQQ